MIDDGRRGWRERKRRRGGGKKKEGNTVPAGNQSPWKFVGMTRRSSTSTTNTFFHHISSHFHSPQLHISLSLFPLFLHSLPNHSLLYLPFSLISCPHTMIIPVWWNWGTLKLVLLLHTMIIPVWWNWGTLKLVLLLHTMIIPVWWNWGTLKLFCCCHTLTWRKAPITVDHISTHSSCV